MFNIPLDILHILYPDIYKKSTKYSRQKQDRKGAAKHFQAKKPQMPLLS
jgi:hypothetical protein